MKNQIDNEFKCLVRIRFVLVYVVLAILAVFLTAIVFYLVVDFQSTERIVIGIITILVGISFCTSEIIFAVREADSKFVINHVECAIISKKGARKINTSDISKIEIVKVLRDAKDIFIYSSQKISDEDNEGKRENIVLVLNYTRKRMKAIKQYCPQCVVNFKNNDITY